MTPRQRMIEALVRDYIDLVRQDAYEVAFIYKRGFPGLDSLTDEVLLKMCDDAGIEDNFSEEY